MKYLLIIILALSITGLCYAEDETEEITLTTYYPAPYGDYDSLVVDNIQITGGTLGADKVLTSDADGIASWQSPAGVEPAYDSDWIADSNATSHYTEFSHNLGYIPRQVQLFFSPTNPPTSVYPKQWSWVDAYSGNPVNIELTTTKVILTIWYGRSLQGVWDPAIGGAAGWTKFYNAGYWRVLLWE